MATLQLSLIIVLITLANTARKRSAATFLFVQGPASRLLRVETLPAYCIELYANSAVFENRTAVV